MAAGRLGPPGVSVRRRVGLVSSRATASALIRSSRAAGFPVWAHTGRTKSVLVLHVTVSIALLDISQSFLWKVLRSSVILFSHGR